MIVKYDREGTAFQLDTDKLPEASIAYLLQYGFAQSMQDTIAGLAKAKRTELEGLDNPPDNIDDEVQLALLAQLEKRQAAILAGTIGVRTSTPRDEVTSLAREQVKAALARKGVKVEKDKLAELVAAHVEKNREKLVAELARRKESQVDIEIDV